MTATIQAVSEKHKERTPASTKLLQIFFRIAAERLRQSDQRYQLLYQKHVKGEG